MKFVYVLLFLISFPACAALSPLFVSADQLQGRNVAATAPTNGFVLTWNNGTSVWEPQVLPASGVSSVSASPPLLSSGGTTPNISVPVATTLVDGYLSHTDWTTFNGKQAAGSYITALTGDVTAAGPGSVASTVASVGGSTAANVNTATSLVNSAQSGNKVFASPSNGSSGSPAFRTLVSADLPAITIPLSSLTAATATNTIDNLNNAQVWNNSTITSETGYKFAATAGSLLTGNIMQITQTVGNASVTGNLLSLVNTGNTTGTHDLDVQNSSGGNSARGILVNMSNSGGGHKAIEVTDASGSANAVGVSVTMSAANATTTTNAIFATTAGTNGPVVANFTSTGATGNELGISIDVATTGSGALGERLTMSSASATGTALSVVHAGTSGYAGNFNSTGTGTRDVVRLQNTVAAANGSEARLTFNALRTTGGSTDFAGVSGILTDSGNTTYKGAVVLYTADNAAMAERMRIDYAGHVLFSGTAPSITANCGSSPTLAGNDSVGRITVGTGGVATNCTITFVKAWTNAPVCFADDESTSLLLTVVALTTTLSISAATPFAASDKLVYHCVGY